jgi:N-acetylneuraminate synthase
LPQEILPALETAYLLGAPILEKHFTHDKSLPGNDHYHAMDKDDLIRFRDRISKIRELIGNHDYKNNLNQETTARTNARRSIVAAKEIPAGKVIDESDLDFKRPGFGVSPMDIDLVVGKKAKKMIDADELINLIDLC